jgi:hypothetical protein
VFHVNLVLGRLKALQSEWHKKFWIKWQAALWAKDKLEVLLIGETVLPKLSMRGTNLKCDRSSSYTSVDLTPVPESL